MQDAFGVERTDISKSFVSRSQLVNHGTDLLRYRPSRIPSVTAIKATALKEKQPELFERRLRELRRNKKARKFRASGEPSPRHPVTNMRSMRYIPKKSVYDPRSSGMNAETYKYLLKYKPSQAVRPPRKRIPFTQGELF